MLEPNVSLSKKPKKPAPAKAPIAYDNRAFAVMELAHDLRRAMVRTAEKLAAREGLTERRLWLLDAVYRGIDRPLQLAQMFDVLPSTITFEANKLATAGFVIREKIPGGGRVARLKLTEAGVALQQDLIVMLNELMKPAVGTLSDEELKTFLANGSRIVNSLKS